MESSSPSLGDAILAELDRRDRAYYYWSILAFIISFLPMMIAFPPWQLSGEYYPESYGTAENSAVHLQALSAFNGYDPYIEILYCVGTRIAVGVIAKFYFGAVRYRDNLISTTRGWENT